LRTILLSSHRVVDRLIYKANLLAGLVERGDATLLYAGGGLTDYWREARRRSPAEVARKLTATARPSVRPVQDSGCKLWDVAMELGVRVERFAMLNDPACLQLVDELQPDLVVNVSTLFVPEDFLGACGHRVAGAHYAELPRLRGGDTIRWSILLDAPMVVSHMFLRKELDLGDVIHRARVPVERGDQIDHIRHKCQEASVAGHLAVADAMRHGTLSAKPQSELDGSMFFRMGTYLRREVEAILSEQRYSHYEGG
jgi:methionyl-tRNA formyltransferase